MLIDHEDLVEQRRLAAAEAAGGAKDADQAPFDASPTFTDTQRRLAAERANDETFAARRLLAITRADRRPHDLAALRATVAQLAVDEGMAEADLRAALDVALRLEGSSLAAWEQQMRRPRVRIGRGAVRHQQHLHGAVS